MPLPVQTTAEINQTLRRTPYPVLGVVGL